MRGDGIYLPGNAVRALDRLGLGELCAGVAPCLALPRVLLHEALLAGADEVPIRWGAGRDPSAGREQYPQRLSARASRTAG